MADPLEGGLAAGGGCREGVEGVTREPWALRAGVHGFEPNGALGEMFTATEW